MTPSHKRVSKDDEISKVANGGSSDISVLLAPFFKAKQLEGLLIASPIQIAYLTKYFGFSLLEREAYLFITKTKQYIITDSRYTHEISTMCPDWEVITRSAEKTTKIILSGLAHDHGVKRLGFEPEILTIAEYKQFKHQGILFVPISLCNLRVKKTPAEIASIQKACEIGDKTFSFLQTKIHAGMTEKELALEMELYIRKQGAHTAFATIVAFGKNAAIPHHHTDDTKLSLGDTILLDFGVRYNNYCSDMTRTIFFKSVTSEQEKIYNTVQEAQQKAITYVEMFLKNNITMKQSSNFVNKQLHTTNVDEVARSYITANKYPSIPHSVGHGIGLEVHESPSLSPKTRPKNDENDILEEGMVFSIEPGIYLPGKTGVRIEDIFTIQNGDLIQLTQSTKQITVV